MKTAEQIINEIKKYPGQSIWAKSDIVKAMREYAIEAIVEACKRLEVESTSKNLDIIGKLIDEMK